MLANNLTPANVKAIYTDPAGNATELSSGTSPVDFLRRSEFQWPVYNRGGEIAPGIALVRGYIRAKDATIRYTVTNNNHNTIRSLTGYTYAKAAKHSETIKEEALKDGIHDHMCDAIRYFFVNCFDSSAWIKTAPEQYSYGVDLHTKNRAVQKRCQICHKQFFSKTSKLEPPFVCRACGQEL